MRDSTEPLEKRCGPQFKNCCSRGVASVHQMNTSPTILVEFDVQGERNAQMRHCDIPKEAMYSSLIPRAKQMSRGF
ncbi:hypothetical protein TNCV_1752161 [Trichonephila clavipes]|nr:hypothetical protein TNCV_1752161 [Trichonephila clavipes]